MTERVGTENDDVITIAEGDTFVDGLGGFDLLRINMSLFSSVDGNETYIITSDRVSDSAGRIDLAFANIERVEFTVSSNDLVTVDASAFVPSDPNALFTLRLLAFGDNTEISGSAYSDSIIVIGRAIVVDGGDGIDVVVYSVSSSAQFVVIGTDGDRVTATVDGFQTLSAVNIERLSISPSTGSSSERIVDASTSAIPIGFSEGAANDVFIGSSFNDGFFVQRQSGSDFSIDRYTGGGGADSYSFLLDLSRMTDTTITDFRPDDYIDFNLNGFSAFPVDTVTIFIGTDSFNGIAGEYRYFTEGGQTFVEADANGDGIADGTLTIANGEFELVEFAPTEGNNHALRIAGFLSGDDQDEDFTGTDAVDRFFASTGNDTIDGGSNVDFAHVSGNQIDCTVTQLSTGVFEVVGPDGTDTLTNIEFLVFDDQTLRLLPGTGVTVNFDTADPSVYQSALEGLRDFDGNDLDGDGSWLRIGSADVNGDGDVDQILVNDAIGRFATVGTADDGLVYFDDHSWAGETRVAGIYIDPLVQSGDVVQGSDNDSQRRFQNDLEIENINRVLGADDYDGDGIWEVYFALTDGTAYLRALMHEDGNIRYANYQSEQEVIDYLTANGYDDNTYGDWFTSSQTSSQTLTFLQSEDKAAPADGFDMIPSLARGFTDDLPGEFYG